MKTNTMKFLFGAILTIVLGSSQAQEVNLDWVYAGGIHGSQTEQFTNCVEGPDGNLYYLGSFNSPYMIFQGDTISQGPVSFQSGFILKTSPTGEKIWLKNLAQQDTVNSEQIIPTGIGFEENGDLIIGGNMLAFSGSIGLDTCVAPIPPVLGFSFNNSFYARLSSDGTCKWLKAALCSCSSFHRDNAGDYVFSGLYAFGVFDILGFPAPPFRGGQMDAFLGKMDADGNALWIQNLGGQDSDGSAISDVYPNGDIIASGNWHGDTVFLDDQFLVNPFPIPFTGNGDTWVAKFKPDGLIIWSVREASMANDGQSYVVALDDGSAISCNNINAETVIGGNNVEPPGSYMVKYDAAGEVVWSKQLGSGLRTNVQLGPDDNIYFSQTLAENSTNIAGIQLFNSNPNSGSKDIIYGAIDTDGNVLWAFIMGSIDDDSGRITPLQNGGFICYGDFIGDELEFGDQLIENVNVPSKDGFYALLDLTVSIETMVNANGKIIMYPNPATDHLNIQLDDSSMDKTIYKIMDAFGRQIRMEQIYVAQNFSIDVSDLSPGVYLIEVSKGSAVYKGKVVVR